MAYYDVLNQPPLYTQGLRALGTYKPQPELEAETSGVLADIADAGLGLIGTLGTVLDTPASVLRGVAAGEFGRALGGVFDPSQRVSGKELFGIEDDPEGWGDDIKGIGAEILTDPLFWLNPLTKAGSVMKAAGQAPKARRAAGTLVEGVKQQGLKQTIRSIADDPVALEKVRQAAKGSKPGLFAKYTGLSKLGTYGDDLLKKIDEGLLADAGKGGIVDEPYRHVFQGFNAWGDTTAPLIDRAVSAVTRRSPEQLASSLDRFNETFRFGDWADFIPRRKAVVAAGQSGDELGDAAKTVPPDFDPSGPLSRLVPDRNMPPVTVTPPVVEYPRPMVDLPPEQLPPALQPLPAASDSGLLRFGEVANSPSGSYSYVTDASKLPKTGVLEAKNKVDALLKLGVSQDEILTALRLTPESLADDGESVEQFFKAFADGTASGRQFDALDAILAAKAKDSGYGSISLLNEPRPGGQNVAGFNPGLQSHEFVKLPDLPKAQPQKLQPPVTAQPSIKAGGDVESLIGADTTAPVAAVDPVSDIPNIANAPDYITKQTKIAARMNELGKREEALIAELGKARTAPDRAIEIEQELADMYPEMEALSEAMTKARPANPEEAAKNIQALRAELAKPGVTPARAEEIQAAIKAAENLGKSEEITKSVAATGQEIAADAALPPAKPAKVGSLKARVRDVLPRPAQQELIGPLPASVPPYEVTPLKWLSELTPGRLPDKEGFNPIRFLARLFERDSRSGTTSAGQILGQEVSSAVATGKQASRRLMVDLVDEIKRTVSPEDRAGTEFNAALRNYIETGATSAMLDKYPVVLDKAQRIKTLLRHAREYMSNRGAAISELDDVIDYLPRNWLRIPGEDFGSSLGSPRHVSPITENMTGRDTKFRGMPTEWFNSVLSHDPLYATADPVLGLRQHLDQKVANGTMTQQAADTTFNNLKNADKNELRKYARETLLNDHKYQGYDAKAEKLAKQELSKKQKALKGQLDKAKKDRSPKVIEQLEKEIAAAEAAVQKFNTARKNAGDLIDLMHGTVQDKYRTYSQKIKKQVGMFSSDVLGDVQKYMDDAARSGAVSEKLIEYLAPRVVGKGQDGTVSLPVALSQLGLGLDNQATNTALERMREALDWQGSMDDLYVPKKVIDEFGRIVGSFKAPAEVGQLVGMFDKGQSFFKNFALMRPGFHGRNKLGGTAQNVMTGLGHSIQGEKEIRALRAGGVIEGASKWPRFADKGLTDAQATDEIRKLFYVYDVVPNHPGMIGDVAASWDDGLAGAIPGLDPDPIRNPLQYIKESGSELKEAWRKGGDELNPLKVRGVGSDDTQFILGKMHEGLGNTTEFQNRGIPFLEGLRRGEDPAQLARSIADAHVDYSNLSTFEREVMRRVMPFYSFSRNMLSHTARQLADRPGGALAQTVRTMRDLRGNEMLPEHLTDTLAIPLGHGEDGSPRYLTGLGLMPEDSLAMLGGAVRTLGGERGILPQLLGMTTPLIKAPVEIATGRTVYQTGPSGGRELRDLDPVLGRIGSNLFGGDPLDTRALDMILMNTIPSQLSMLKTATDGRKGVIARGANLLTGAKVTDVPQKTQEALIRQQVQELLRELGGRGYERFYMPDDAMAKLPPEEQARAKALNNLLNELANRAKSRAKQAKEPVGAK